MKKIILLSLTLHSIISYSQVTNYSASYGFTGYQLDQPEIQFNLETTYESNERFTQLYSWRYAMGDYKGLIFEYNNRMYFGKDRVYDNSKWFIQGKIGYGLLKGDTYKSGTISTYDSFGNYLGLNTVDFIDNRRFSYNYGLALGYKFIAGERITLDCFVGYVGYSKTNFELGESKFTREKKWNDGIASPIEFHWSIGFFLD